MPPSRTPPSLGELGPSKNPSSSRVSLWPAVECPNGSSGLPSTSRSTSRLSPTYCSRGLSSSGSSGPDSQVGSGSVSCVEDLSWGCSLDGNVDGSGVYSGLPSGDLLSISVVMISGTVGGPWVVSSWMIGDEPGATRSAGRSASRVGVISRRLGPFRFDPLASALTDR